jgi:hypothetical protein
MKRKPSALTAGVLLFAAFLIIISCRKVFDEKIGSDVTTSFGIKDARKFFYNTLRKQQAALAKGADKKIYPYWSLAYEGKTNKYAFVEVPFILPKMQHYSLNIKSASNKTDDRSALKIVKGSLSRLVLYKNNKGTVGKRIITYIPDLEYLEKHNNDISHNQIDKLDADFNGFLRYSTIDGKYLFTLKIKDGKSILKYSPNLNFVPNSTKGTSGKKGGKTMNIPPGQICDETLWTLWEQECEYFFPDGPQGPEVEVCDDPYIIDQWYEYTNCYADCSDPINFNTAECGYDEEEPLDCAGVPGGSAYMAECGCIGGTTGISECTVIIPLDTTRNIVDSCINAAVNQAFSTNLTGKMKDIMQNTILNNDQLKLKIRDSAWPDTLNGGYFQVLSRTNASGTMVLNAEIVLNTSALAGSANEYRVAIFYHEVLHAYLATLLNLNPGYLNNINDHSTIAYDYVDMLRTSLQTLFPSITSSDANALAWEGLSTTPFWGLRTPSQQQGIQLINQQYREGQKGNKCN